MLRSGKYFHLILLLIVMNLASATSSAETVLITGANQGIGLEFARQYADRGWTVIATHRRTSVPDTLAKLAAQYPSVRIETLDVTVSNGWVMLRGEVEWEYQRRAAERSVRRLVGVRGVSNSVAVRPRLALSPEDRARRIRAALARRVDTGGEQVTIDVRRDEVVLGGSVPSWIEREEAERVAWSAPGVRTVANHITVRV